MSACIRTRGVEVSLVMRLLAVSSASASPVGEGSCPPERIGIRPPQERVSFSLLADSRLRAEALQSVALRHDDDCLESIGVRLIRGGRLSEIAYVGDISHIQSLVPGGCPCCQRELAREETPIAP